MRLSAGPDNTTTQPNQTASKSQPAASNQSAGSGFTIVGIVTFGIILWTASQNATGQARKIINGFLGVLLLSMMLLNWSKIKPIFFKS